DGLHYCQRAEELQKQALALAPRNPALCNDWLQTRETLSALRLLKGEIGHDERILQQQQILRERAELARRDPQSSRWRSEASAAAAVLAGLLHQAGRQRQAIEVVEQALPPHEDLLRADQQRWQEALAGRDPQRGDETALQVLAVIAPRREVPPS